MRRALASLSCVMLLAAAPAPADTVPRGTPAALRAGQPLADALGALNASGHRIVYSSALVAPDMVVREAPKASRIDALLAEILAPWSLRAIRASNGDWLVVAALPSAPPTTSTAAPVEDDALEIINVTASRYELAGIDASNAFLDRAGVERLPHLADDALRMLKVLPGVAGGDFSAALNIRGGRRDETLLKIDGAEIHNGFHFRDLDGALSVLDTHLVEDMEFVTGGMTADHADYMSGGVSLRTRRARPDDEYRSAVGLSFVSAYARTGGTFAGDRGAWLVAGRRGYLDVVLKRTMEDDETLTPRYNDLFASLDYELGDQTTLGVRMLLGTDDLRLVSDSDEPVDSAGKGEAGHLWTTLSHEFGDALRVDTVLAAAHVVQTRDSAGEDELRAGDVDADFRFGYLDLRQDWSWTLDERHLLRGGVAAGRATADYEYALSGYIRDPLALSGRVDIARSADLDLTGTKLGAWAAWRASLVPGLTTELGLRWDQYEYPGDLRFDTVSPRVNAVYALGERGELRAAWGVMHQGQGLDELQVEDGVTQFFEPERARHAVIGYAHRFDDGLALRADVYAKDYSRLRARYENVLDSMQLIPEASVDRLRIDAPQAEARGVEVTLRRDAERGLAGWFSMTFARVRDHDAEGWTPRTWDQERSLSFGASWIGANWNIGLAGLYHTGTPTTRLRVAVVPLPGGGQGPVVVAGPRNGARLGDYQRIDLRAKRDVQLRSGRLSWYLEVTNLFDRKNPCCVEYYENEQPNGQVRAGIEETYWLPMLPSFGVQFEF